MLPLVNYPMRTRLKKVRPQFLKGSTYACTPSRAPYPHNFTGVRIAVLSYWAITH